MNNALLNQKINPTRFGSEPHLLMSISKDDLFKIPSGQIAEIQVAGLRTRFHQMMEKIPVLRTLADEHGITEINKIEDAAALLFKHSVYKSYPLSFIEKNRFDRMTEWLDKLTTLDLSGLDASGIDSIDDWLDLLDTKTPMRAIHTTGTSGKLSFLPRSESEIPAYVRNALQQYTPFGKEPGVTEAEMEKIPFVFPGYRHSAMGQSRLFDGLVKYLYGGDESMMVTLNPGRLSADALSLGGRLMAAEAKGELGRLQISPKLMSRREHLLKEQAASSERAQTFFKDLKEKYAGRRMAMIGNWSHLYDLAVEGQKNGVRQVFTPDTLISQSGGFKGRKLPDDFKTLVMDFLGVKAVVDGYGMSELTCLSMKCPQGYYHIPPFQIPFLLDPATGTPYPRNGTQTGRFGAFDLGALTYWAGFLTGDELTITWDAPCACGRIGPYIHEGIRRYSEKEGGDDKITCAGAPEAHDKAIAMLSGMQ